jgi:hypothetical protein
MFVLLNKYIKSSFSIVAFLLAIFLFPLTVTAQSSTQANLSVSVRKKLPTDTINDFDFSSLNSVTVAGVRKVKPDQKVIKSSKKSFFSLCVSKIKGYLNFLW